MWVVQSNLISEHNLREIVNILSKNKIPFIDCGVIPFSHDLITTNPIPNEKVIIPYGSTRLSKIAFERGWSGLFFDDKRFMVSRWIKERDDMLNYDSFFLTVKEAGEYFTGCTENLSWFIRPEKDLKEFNGTISVTDEIGHWMGSIDSGSFSFSDDTRIAVAPLKNIVNEWRYFVVDGKVVDGSLYRVNGTLCKEHCNGTYEHVQSFADKWLPSPVCCMDLCMLDDDSMWVLEFNTFNSTGFYDHDIEKIILAVDKYANKES